MLVKPRICDDSASYVCGDRTNAEEEPFDMFGSDSGGSAGVGIVCSASIVADGGGGFSPRMLLCG